MTFPMLPTLVWNYNKANIAAKTHLDFSLNGIKKIAWPILKITSQLTQKTFFFFANKTHQCSLITDMQGTMNIVN